MRNLKKILALVLALVMSMSLVTVASAAYPDEDQIDARYAEAVEVLSDMGIFKGDDKGNFNPKALINREQVATMMYRVISKDVKDNMAGLYVEAANFSDVAEDKWSAGYIGYCFNGNYIKGYEDGTFGPSKYVTGYEVLAMILRAVGYDQNGEFSGSNWKKNIGTVAQQLGILDRVDPKVVLSDYATRELVAELIFRTMATVDMVEYTPAFSYQPILINTGTATTTLGLKNFGLEKSERTEIDSYMRPGYFWTCSKYPYTTTTIEEAVVSEYFVPVTECQLMLDLGKSGTKTVGLYVNGNYHQDGSTKVVHDYTYDLEAIDYTNTLGGQGTELELYADRIVIINTWLAEVTNVTPVVKDPAGHVVNSATVTVDVYDQADGTATSKTWNASGYKVGDLLLVQGYAKNHVDANNVVVHDAITYVKVMGNATSVVGGQTYIWANADKHTVEGKTYDDAETFYRDEADVLTGDYQWLFDLYGNLIGAVELPEVNVYGIIENIQWYNPQMAAGYAQATIRYIDGNTAVKNIYSVDGTVLKYDGVNDTVGTDGAVSDNFSENAAWCGKHLYKIVDTAYGAVLTHVVDGADKAEVIKANVLTGNYIVTGRDTADTADITEYINGETVFMVKIGREWKLITGYENIGNYSTNDDVTIDYLEMNDGDPYLDFVFLTGTADSSSATSLFYKTSDNYGYDPTTGVFTYFGLIDGVAGELKTTNADVIALAKYTLVELNYVDGDVDSITEFDFTSSNVDTTALGANVTKLKASAAQYASNTTYDGFVLAGNTYTSMFGSVAQNFNVVGLNTTYGEWEGNLGDHEIWVVWKSVNGANVASQVYIAPSAVQDTENANGNGNTPSNAAKMSVEGYNYNGTQFSITIKTPVAIDAADTYAITIKGSDGGEVYKAPATAFGSAYAADDSITLTAISTVGTGDIYTITIVYSIAAATEGTENTVQSIQY